MFCFILSINYIKRYIFIKSRLHQYRCHADKDILEIYDDLVQASIWQKFSECSVISIAHRLNTIMDTNRVMVRD